jgi:hypothetical protein
MPINDVVNQDAILRELGISLDSPGAKTTAQKVSNDHLVLDRAMQLAIADRIPEVLAALTPTERARLVKRTGSKPTFRIEVGWAVGRTITTGEWYILATATKFLGEKHVELGKQYFTGSPERAKCFKPFGETCPPEIAAEYVRSYEHILCDSRQSSIYNMLSAPTPAPDLSVCPGPNFAGTSKPKINFL